MQAFDSEWYAVGLSEEFRRGRKRSVRLYGRELVLWRSKAGELAALDARCPHMGASLATGRVRDDHVECPYHGFQFDRSGRCVRTPRRAVDALIPKTMCARRYEVRERCGWVFVYWGEPDRDLPDPPFFEAVEAADDKLQHCWTAKSWPLHFTRFIENTVDVAHLGTVHRSTLAWSLPDPIDVGTGVDGNLISVYPPSTTDLPVLSQILYPNMSLLHLNPKFLTVFAGVPVDENTTRLYVRSSLGYARLPLIGRFATWLKHRADMAALWQDEGSMLNIEPKSSDDAVGEVLMEFDCHIAEYRKMRRRKLAALDRAEPSAAGTSSN